MAAVVDELIKDKFTGIGRGYKPRHIVEDMRREYGVNISYDKAWSARETAYALARYMFMALGPCIRGFSSCRPMIIIDGSHLKGKYKGTMLVGISMDGNNQVYPLVYAIVDNETDRAWKWFMSNLKCAIGEPPNLVFVSDRAENTIVGMFKNAARAFRMAEFQVHWDQLRILRNGAVSRYLEDIGLERWARVYQTERRYDNMTSNSAECFNSLTKEYRQLPIMCLLEHVQGLIQS
ncbi:uncharacterized protein LOC120088929 [Benincasa hispida]|uniref:uncharacterized protein LOC120088929 n=1 Tax=Benincasa hispida TaxID=102211 RepID=UPI0018FFD43F|nr:uncharacterized protein LOC120088929 [Benincasa hispida]